MSTTDLTFEITETDTGFLGVYHLKKFWWCVLSKINRQSPVLTPQSNSHLDYIVVNALGLNYEQTLRYLYQVMPRFDEFEHWVLDITGGIDETKIEYINAAICGTEYPSEIKEHLAYIEQCDPVLSEEDLQFWHKNGYVIVRNAVSLQNCGLAVEAILNHVEADYEQPDSWYKYADRGTMLHFFQHPSLKANRDSSRIHKAFSQLWGTADLWVSTDDCIFNVPERPGWLFKGPDLHWDIKLEAHIPFGTQAILYLTDTPPEQGALKCVPGFHLCAEEWIKNLPQGSDPNRQNLKSLKAKAVEGKAGDLIIWHQSLPHGFTANRGSKPMIAQYLNLYPASIIKQ